ncbi:hypothetical protein QWJ07_34790 [Frankia sp. RB7]|nr:hypothetical protein [Frankia sp. RB7]
MAAEIDALAELVGIASVPILLIVAPVWVVAPQFCAKADDDPRNIVAATASPAPPAHLVKRLMQVPQNRIEQYCVSVFEEIDRRNSVRLVLVWSACEFRPL